MTTPQDLVEAALSASTADHTVVVVRASSTANMRWANNTLTTNGIVTSSHVTVISVIDGEGGPRAGVLTRAAATSAQVRNLTLAADAAAREADPAPDAAPLVDAHPSRDFGELAGATSIDAFEESAHDLRRAFDRSQAAGRLLYGYAEQDLTTTYVASSTGLRLRHEQPTANVGMTGKRDDLSASAWVGHADEDIRSISIESMADRLEERLSWGARRVELPAGHYSTILPPTAVADLMVYAYHESSGRDAAEGKTVYSSAEGRTRVGERLARSDVRLWSDPHLAGLAAAPFVAATSSSSIDSVFDNGTALTATDWIRDGTLRALRTSRYTAALTGLAHTPRIDNLALSVDSADGSVEDLVASTERGLLVTCLWYIRAVDRHTLLLTGLTRDGVYLVEGGQVVGAVNNFRFNESPVDLLNRFDRAGSTLRTVSREWGDLFPRTAMPALRVPDFNMSSVSQAT
jgi:predicted Zn-dependent protease